MLVRVLGERRLDDDGGYLDGFRWHSGVGGLLQVGGQVLVHVFKDQREFGLAVGPRDGTHVKQPGTRGKRRRRTTGFITSAAQRSLCSTMILKWPTFGSTHPSFVFISDCKTLCLNKINETNVLPDLSQTVSTFKSTWRFYL